MTLAWQGWEGQRDTLWCLAPVGIASALREMVLVIMFIGESVLGGRLGLQVTHGWDKPLALVQPGSLSSTTAFLSTQDSGTCF